MSTSTSTHSHFQTAVVVLVNISTSLFGESAYQVATEIASSTPQRDCSGYQRFGHSPRLKRGARPCLKVTRILLNAYESYIVRGYDVHYQSPQHQPAHLEEKQYLPELDDLQ